MNEIPSTNASNQERTISPREPDMNRDSDFSPEAQDNQSRSPTPVTPSSRRLPVVRSKERTSRRENFEQPAARIPTPVTPLSRRLPEVRSPERTPQRENFEQPAARTPRRNNTQRIRHKTIYRRRAGNF